MSGWRYHPFTGLYYPSSIVQEEHTIAYIADWNAYGIELDEAPDRDYAVTIVEDVTGGATFTEVGQAVSPSAGEYRVDYDDDGFFATGRVEFNSADNGKAVLVSYYGRGQVAKPSSLLSIGRLTSGKQIYCKEVSITINAGDTSASVAHGITNAATDNLIVDVRARQTNSAAIDFAVAAALTISDVNWSDVNITANRGGSGSTITYTLLIFYKEP